MTSFLFLLGSRRGLVAPPGPVGGSTISAITARSPTIYYTIDGGAAAASTDNGSAGLTLTASGSNTKTASGWILPGGSYLEVAHDAAFETDLGTAHRWVDSEITLRLGFRVSSLASQVALCAKGVGGRHDHSWWVDIEADGTLSFKTSGAWHETEIESPAGTIAVDTDYVLCLQFGRRGVQMWIDANSCDNGYPNPQQWYGWDHRLRGNEAGVNGARWLNNHPLRLGHNGFSASGEVKVTQFAVFVSGGENADPWTRTGTRLARADVEAISETSGTGDLNSRLHGGTETNVATSDDLKAIAGATSPGDVLLLAAGVHNVTGDWTLPNGVRIAGAGVGSTTIAMSSGAHVLTPNAGTWTDWTPNDTGLGDLAAGADSWTVGTGHGFAAGDWLLLISTVLHRDDVWGTGGSTNTSQKRSQMVRLRSAGTDTLNFEQPLLKAYPDAERSEVWKFASDCKHTWIDDLTITVDRAPEGPNYNYMVQIRGADDFRVRGAKLHQDNAVETANADPGPAKGIQLAEHRGCIALTVQDSVYQNDAYSQTPHATPHDYPCNVSACENTVFQNCTVEGNHERIDWQRDNIGGEIGGSGPSTGIVLCGNMSQAVDCNLNSSDPDVTGTDSFDQLGVGGHEQTEMRFICADSETGWTGWRGVWGCEYAGIRTGKYHMSYGPGGGRDSYAIHYRSDVASDDKLYKAAVNEGIKSGFFVDIAHNGSGAVSSNYVDATFENVTFVNCDTPHP